MPKGDDQNVYLVVDDLGPHGQVWREAEAEATDLGTIVTDLLDGQYNCPVRVVTFNTVEGWARDVSRDVAHELRRRCDLELTELPAGAEDFVGRFEADDHRQLTLRLVDAHGGPRMTVWVYVETSKCAGDDDYLLVFVSADAAEAWMAEHKVVGFAIECPVRGDKGGELRPPSTRQ